MQLTSASRIAVMSILLYGAAPVSFSQDAPKVFSSRSEVVVVHVTVTDGKLRPVAGLPRDAFAVYEDGRPESVTFFRNEDNPVTVGLVLDCSGSMQRKRDAVIAAGMAFARSSHPRDEMFTVNFNEGVWDGLPPSVPFTTDEGELYAALQRTTARGQTALFDAVRAALKHLQQGHEQKKVLIVVSDGGDNASAATFADVLDQALRMDAIIYTIGMRDQYDSDAKPQVLKKLSNATGGEAFFPHNPDDTSKILEQIAHDIRTGYTLGYSPSQDAPGYRTIRVDVHGPDGRKLNVRARSGYIAGPATEHDRH
jgi:Ca-activated chloride channel family protein